MTKLNRMILTFVCLFLFAGLTAKCSDDGGGSDDEKGTSDSDTDTDTDSDSDSDSDGDADNASQSDSVKGNKKNNKKNDTGNDADDDDDTADDDDDSDDSDGPKLSALGEGCFLMNSGTCAKNEKKCEWGTIPEGGIWERTKMLSQLMPNMSVQTECEPELTCCINEGFCEEEVQGLFSAMAAFGGGVTTWSCQESECTESINVMLLGQIEGFQSGCENKGWCCPHKEAPATTDNPDAGK